MKRLLGTIFLIVFVLIIALALVFYAKGKRLTSDGKLVDTGVIQIDSTPNDAKVFVDGKEKGKSDTNIENLRPGQYTIKLEKDRYQTWEKIIEVKKGLVTPLKISLFPSNPTLTALTFDGVFGPKLSPDNKKVVYGVQSGDKAGLWTLELANRQFFSDNDPEQLITDSSTFVFSKSSFIWSPSSSEVLVEVQKTGTTETVAFLLKQGQNNSNPEDVTSRLALIKQDWQNQAAQKDLNRLTKLGETAAQLATGAKEIKFSRDAQAVLIIKEDKTAIVFDTKPNQVPGSKPATYQLPAADYYGWFQADSKHLIVIDASSLGVIESDGSNKVGLFSGDFDLNSVFSWPDGSKMVISINLNSRSNPLPNLYTIDLRP